LGFLRKSFFTKMSKKFDESGSNCLLINNLKVLILSQINDQLMMVLDVENNKIFNSIQK
jgi:hypothetical protein